MATIADIVRERLEARPPTARELERINNPRRYAARLRAEAYRRKKCPARKLAVVTQQLKDFRAPIKAKAEALRGVRVEFGGNLARYAVYHMIDRHRRGSSFTPLVQQFLADYNAARQQDRTLTREKFFSTYSDHILRFLLSYRLIERPTSNAARIESLTLHFLVAAVAESREKYGKDFDAVCEIERKAHARFLALDNAEIKQVMKRDGFSAAFKLQREREAQTKFKAFKLG